MDGHSVLTQEGDPEVDQDMGKPQKSFLFSLLQKAMRPKETEQQPVAEAVADAQPEVEVKPERPTYLMPDSIASYRRGWRGIPENETLEIGHLTSCPTPPDPAVLEACFTQLGREADRLLEHVIAPDGSQAPMDATVRICVSENKVWAWCFLFPPLNGGADLEPDDIAVALAGLHITCGVQKEVVEELSDLPIYLKLILLAEGTAPINGENGWVEDIIPRTVGTPFLEDDGGAVDFKSLNWVVRVAQDQVICEIHPPTEQQPGTSVFGAPVLGKNGNRATIPAGTNTGLNEDGTALVARVDGQIFFDHDKYRVNQMVTIEGDVDLSTGNLEIVGNLLIKGNVREGFSAQATGDITIQGLVEGATVVAGGNIFVKMGMNGNSHGTMDAGKDIKCRYLENTSVRASGSIYMESVVNSTVISDQKVVATSGRGVIIGGSISAMIQIEAKIIGNKLEHANVLVIDRSAHFIREKERITAECEQSRLEGVDLQAKIDRLSQKIDAATELLLKSTRFKLSVAHMKEANLRKNLEQMMQQEQLISNGFIRAGLIYPIAQVTIGSVTRVFCERCVNCRLSIDKGDIRIGGG